MGQMVRILRSEYPHHNFISYPKVPDDPDFNGADGGAFRFVGPSHHVLLEDNYLEYGEFVIDPEGLLA